MFKSVMHQKEFIDLGKFLSTIGCKFKPLMVAENTELVQYGIEDLFVAVEAIPEKHFLPTGEIKKEAALKAKCLESMGWMYIGIRWKTFRELPRNKQLEWIKEALKKAIGRQIVAQNQALKDNRDTVDTIIQLRDEADMHPETLEDMLNDTYSD